jgi:hypothetical protein
MADARSSVHMSAFASILATVRRTTARMVRWSLSPVEDGPRDNVIPMPGPAHGPIPAIHLRLEDEQRRKAS